jgi:hypothetical protein
MNVLVLKSSSRVKGIRVVKRGKELGEIGTKPHIMEVGSATWTKIFIPLFEKESSKTDDVIYFDVFGVYADVVPIIEIKKMSKGGSTDSRDVEWQATRTAETFTIIEKLRKMVINIVKHETNIPHTQKELKEIFNLAAVNETSAAVEEEEEYSFAANESEYSSLDEDDTADVDEPEDDEDLEDEEEVKPKKKKKAVKPEKKEKSKKKKKAKVVEEEDEDVDVEDDEDEDFLSDNDYDEGDEDDEDFLSDDDED